MSLPNSKFDHVYHETCSLKHVFYLLKRCYPYFIYAYSKLEERYPDRVRYWACVRKCHSQRALLTSLQMTAI